MPIANIWFPFIIFQGTPARNGSGQLCHPKLDPESDPIVGETYLSHFSAPVTSDLKMSGEVPCRQWFRVRALALQSAYVKVLAIDFGFSANLPAEALFTLTKECRGIPPQVNWKIRTYSYYSISCALIAMALLWSGYYCLVVVVLLLWSGCYGLVIMVWLLWSGYYGLVIETFLHVFLGYPM